MIETIEIFITLGSCIIYLISMLILFIYTYYKYDKEIKGHFDQLYYREFTNLYDVEIVEYIMTKKSTINGFSAMLSNMVYKENLKIKELDKNTYEFELITKTNLSDLEIYTIEFLFNVIGKDNKVTNIDIVNYSQNTDTALRFSSYFENWQKKVIKTGESLKIYEDNSKLNTISGIMFGISLIIFFIIATFRVYPVIGLSCIAVSIIYAIYAYTLKKLTPFGKEQYSMWKGFKKFIKDFGNFQDKSFMHIKLWERYLVYATALGIADEVAETVKIDTLKTNQIVARNQLLYQYKVKKNKKGK